MRADITIWRMQQPYNRLYEQAASVTRVDVYVKHWIGCVHAGRPNDLMAIDITRDANTIELIRDARICRRMSKINPRYACIYRHMVIAVAALILSYEPCKLRRLSGGVAWLIQ